MQFPERHPPYQGPTLGPFRLKDHKNPNVDFLDVIGEGLHSKVYQARIDGKIYALKAFVFYQADKLVAPNYLDDGFIDADTVFHVNDPFYAECRAYGRLEETQRQDLAVRCHGYIILSRTQEATLEETLGGSEEGWCREGEQEFQGVRCIVKEYIDPQQDYFTFRQIPRMKRDLRHLSNLGIVVHDIRTENYLGGRIIDFSQAHTVPHFMLDVTSSWFEEDQIRMLCVKDFEDFDYMIRLWNTDHPTQHSPVRFFPNKAFGSRLRNGARYEIDASAPEVAGLRTALYNWKGKPKPMKEVKSKVVCTKRLVNGNAKKGTTRKQTCTGKAERRTRRAV